MGFRISVLLFSAVWVSNISVIGQDVWTGNHNGMHFYIDIDKVSQPTRLFDSFLYSWDSTLLRQRNNVYPETFLHYDEMTFFTEVYRYIPAKGNDHLFKNPNKKSYYLDHSKYYEKATNEELNIQTAIQPMGYFMRYLNTDIDSIIGLADTADFNPVWNDFEYTRGNMENQHGDGFYVNESGRLNFKYPYKPDSFAIQSLTELIFEGYFENGTLTFYESSHFPGRRTVKESRKILFDSADNKIQITGVRLKEYYYIDMYTGKLESDIIGLGLVGTDTNAGNELAWVYYPELSWAMLKKCAIYENSVVNLEYLLDNHLFKGFVELNDGSSLFEVYSSDQSWLLRFYPEMILKMQEERLSIGARTGLVKLSEFKGLPACEIEYDLDHQSNGQFKVYDFDGNLWIEGQMNDGKPNGEFNFNYSSGGIKAIRNYKAGRLQGKQVNYWKGGGIAAVFEMKNHQISSLSRNYETGENFEKGKFQNGLPLAEWTYNLSIQNDSIADLVQSRMPSVSKSKKNLFSYKVEYSHNHGSDCYFPKFTCLEYKIKN